MIRAGVGGFLCLLTLLLILGCGGGSSKQQISGKVTFKNQPLNQGRIEFAKSADAPPSTGAVIENGQYTIPAAQGLEPGKYRIAIYSSGTKAAAADQLPGEPPPPTKELIPAKYNEKSDQYVEVKSAGNNVFDFQID